MRSIAAATALFLASSWSAFGKAYFYKRSELIHKAQVIAIIDVGEPADTPPEVRGQDPFEPVNRNWTYGQQAKARVEKILKGQLPKEFTLYGKESFICAHCDLAKGRFLAFLTKDGDLWVGANWQLSLRPIRDAEVEWFVSEDQRFPMKFQRLDEVVAQIQLATLQVEYRRLEKTNDRARRVVEQLQDIKLEGVNIEGVAPSTALGLLRKKVLGEKEGSVINFVIRGSEQGQSVTIKADKTTYAQVIDQICVQTGLTWNIEFNEPSEMPVLVIKQDDGQQAVAPDHSLPPTENLGTASPDGAFQVSIVKVGETNTRRLEISDKSGKILFSSQPQIQGTDILDFYSDHLRWSPDSRILAIAAGYPKHFRTYLFAWDGKGFHQIVMPEIASGEDNPWIYPTEWKENHILHLKFSGPHAGKANGSGYEGTAVAQVDLQAMTAKKLSEEVKRHGPDE